MDSSKWLEEAIQIIKEADDHLTAIRDTDNEVLKEDAKKIKANNWTLKMMILNQYGVYVATEN